MRFSRSIKYCQDNRESLNRNHNNWIENNSSITKNNDHNNDEGWVDLEDGYGSTMEQQPQSMWRTPNMFKWGFISSEESSLHRWSRWAGGDIRPAKIFRPTRATNGLRPSFPHLWSSSSSIRDGLFPHMRNTRRGFIGCVPSYATFIAADV